MKESEKRAETFAKNALKNLSIKDGETTVEINTSILEKCLCVAYRSGWIDCEIENTKELMGFNSENFEV